MSGPVLDHSGIAARIPHGGSMCLLDRVRSCSGDTVVCSARSHRSPDNPLRSAGLLAAACAVEYAAQAMALHGALSAPEGEPPAAGLVASVRSVRLHVTRLDDIEGELRVTAQRLAGDAGQALYRFSLHDAGDRLLADGRATVILRAAP